MNLFKRSHMCTEVTENDIGREIVLNGWIQKRRDLGKLIFCDMRDKTGIIQVVFDEDHPQILDQANSLRSEYVVGVKGKVRPRESINKDLKTGSIEVLATSLEIYSQAETPPIYVKDDDNVDENLRLKYRYLDLRKQKMQKNLSFRSKVVGVTRNFFLEEGFTDVETPVLVKPTPEGARDYLVPSRVNKGNFYALPQSPQLYKQLLMAGGTDRYIQIAKCFRDEDLRADRQPEFTQIDLEMSFADINDVIEVQEAFLKRIFKEVMNIDIQIPFPRYSYKEAMERFGSDKPDTRFGMELIKLNDVVKDCQFKVFTNALQNGGDIRGICVKNAADKFSRKDIDRLTDALKSYGAKGMAWVKVNENGVSSSFSKFFSEEEMSDLLTHFESEVNDLVFIVADEASVVFDSLGFLRNEMAKRLELVDKNTYDLLWVVDFPLLEYDRDEKRYFAKHHPFTSPNMDDIDKLDSDPESVRADAYDIVMNGVEIGGGSVRIHDRKLQNKLFEVLGLTEDEIESKFGFLLEAFRYGVPPHAGLAYGLDRLVMLLLGEDSIRETIAFPKNQNAVDMVSNAPGEISDDQAEELGIKICREK